MGDPQASLSPCPEKQVLSEVLLEAVRELNELVDAQAKSLMNGQPKLERFDMALAVARERRTRAKLAYTLHVQSHGC